MELGKIEVTARGIIINDGKLLVFKLSPQHTWYSLPGGRVEIGETTEEAMAREIKEETGKEAKIGKLLIVHEFINKNYNRHRIEFFYEIKNGADFQQIDFKNCTHGFEVCDTKWVLPSDTETQVLPEFLKDVTGRIVEGGIDNWQLEKITLVG